MGTVEAGRHGKAVGSTIDVNPAEVHEISADFVHFVRAGERVKGEFHCTECGYGVTVYRVLPRCPMCGNDSWEQSAWSPFAHARSIFQ